MNTLTGTAVMDDISDLDLEDGLAGWNKFHKRENFPMGLEEECVLSALGLDTTVCTLDLSECTASP